ncbi:hypothetical protein ACRE_062630 [Hapsidospora chrysogenum ATCC 11550]|uniref:Uncharacterized protein n=1 Tax=Hapsidospora chrysogenum (strain ATCC 11550 / CBS 779.69 / DSM 880 / IAM 14645 / JCM 23072 / IMI 49137) TaxID=857340 RepID=A0A086T0U8_HAPC1|nr:hypothetical protein ACRE_062630 [Hapsidospora chrysogenum ATCC 11550]
MRFTTAFIACGLAVAASAQSTTADAPSSTVSLDPAQSSVIACLDDCDDDDLACLSRCNPVPNPNKDQVKDTHDCVTKCDQGEGSAADTKKYGDCVAVCIKEHFYDSEQGTPDPNGGGSGNDDDSNDDSSNDDASNDDGSNDDSSNDDSNDDSESGSQPSASSTGASPTESGSGDEASGTADEGAASETADDDGAATGLIASSAALFGAFVAVLAL